MENSTIDHIISEEHFKESLIHRASTQFQRGAHMARVVRLRKILYNIEHNLKKEGPYPLDKVATFLENFEMYPEVRPLAEKILPKIIEGETVGQKRLAAYNRLRRKMKEIQR